MINNKLLLSVDHKIFLKEEEINFLKENNFLETQGFNIPVWLNILNGKTSEPAEEIFCNYIIYNDINNESFVGLNKKNIYEIYLPQNKTWIPPKPINFENLSNLSYEQRILDEEKRQLWWNKNPKPPCLDSFLNSKFLNFEVRKIESFKNIKIIIKHDVQISFMSVLENSIVN